MSGDEGDDESWTDEHSSVLLLLEEKAEELPEGLRDAVTAATSGKYVTQTSVQRVASHLDSLDDSPLKNLVSPSSFPFSVFVIVY